MSTEPNKPDPKDSPFNLRMLLAFALTGLVIFGTPYYYKWIGVKPPAEKTEQAVPPASAPKSTSTPAAAAATPPAKSNPAKPGSAPPDTGAIAGTTEDTVSLDTDLYRIIFTNRGGRVKSWTLKKFKDHDGKPLEIVNPAAVEKKILPFQYEFRGAKPPADLNEVLFHASASPDGPNPSVTFEYSNAGVTANKSFTFRRDSYLLQVSSAVTSNAQPLSHLLVWRGGFGDLAVPNAASQQSYVFYDTAADKIDREKAKAAKNGPVSKDGTFAWVGLEDQYFAAVYIPTGNGTLQTTIFDDQETTPYNHSEDSFIGMGAGGDANNRFAMFVGPKDVETLRKVSPKLEQIVDFGWFAIIAKPLFQSLHWMNDNWFHNYGWSIIVATIIINLVLFPLKLANLKSMRKMQAMQPEIAKINEKYKAIPMRDPRQADKNQEMMALYSKAGTNPLSGCIPMLIQMPFLFAFYKVLSVTIAMRGASWLWVGDLSQPEQLAIRILPIILVVSGFVMQKMTPMTTVDPAQQKTMMLMPLMMGFIFYQAQSGLVLYWLTGNLVGIAQQWLLNKAMPQPAPAAKEVKKSNNRK